MQSDLDGCDLSPSELILSSDVTGLAVYQCENWAQGSSHGGVVSTVQIHDGHDILFPRTSLEDNISGATYYYKTFWKNLNNYQWPDLKAEVTINSSSTFSRETVTIALGTDTDDMSSIPDAVNFSSSTPTVVGGSTDCIPIWIKQRILPGGLVAERGQNIQVQITLVVVE